MNTQSFYSRIRITLAFLFGGVIIGVVGFMAIEKFSFVDALYMTIITVSTVGFAEVKTLSQGGRIFTIFLIITSFGTFAYAVTVLSQSLLNGDLRKALIDRQVRKKVNKLKDHVVVCGYGRNGRQAIKKLRAYGKDFVVIERDEERVERLKTEGIAVIHGDSTRDGVLEQAGVEKASALITTLPSDAENLFVVLSARELNKNMTVIARASSENSERKFKAAGANNVIMPDKVGGAHMASLVVTPDVVEFLDHISVEGSAAINLEEVPVDEIPEQYQMKSLIELGIRNVTGCNVIGFKTPEGEYVINPDANTKLVPNSKLFVLGVPEQINKLNNLFKLDKNEYS